MSLIETILSVALIFGPIVGYIPQYREIYKTSNTSGFSTLVCFILIISNLLRIFFWTMKRFELTLLFQSVVMIIAQLALLELIIRLDLKTRPNRNEKLNYSVPLGFSFEKFWGWDYFGEYLAFLVTFISIIGPLVVCNIYVFHSSILMETIGTMALLIESTLAMPQAYQNWKNHSCRGLRPELVATWFLGDAFKTILFISRNAPYQFLMCGFIQLAVDVLVSHQMYTYPSHPVYLNNPSMSDDGLTRGKLPKAHKSNLRF